MQTLTIAGIEYPGRCICDGFHLFIYLDNMSMIEGFPILSNPGNLAVIHENSYEHERDYAGYTVLQSISGEYGNCNAVLVREANNA